MKEDERGEGEAAGGAREGRKDWMARKRSREKRDGTEIAAVDGESLDLHVSL